MCKLTLYPSQLMFKSPKTGRVGQVHEVGTSVVGLCAVHNIEPHAHIPACSHHGWDIAKPREEFNPLKLLRVDGVCGLVGYLGNQFSKAFTNSPKSCLLASCFDSTLEAWSKWPQSRLVCKNPNIQFGFVKMLAGGASFPQPKPLPLWCHMSKSGAARTSQMPSDAAWLFDATWQPKGFTGELIVTSPKSSHTGFVSYLCRCCFSIVPTLSPDSHYYFVFPLLLNIGPLKKPTIPI